MKKAVIYGIGQEYHANADWLKKHYDIVALIDSNTDIKTLKNLDFDQIIVTPHIAMLMSYEIY